jgi:6-phosphogluconolactonase
MSLQRELLVLNSTADLSQAASREFIELARQSIAARGRFSVALSGGSTPRGLFTLLGNEKRSELEWDRICFFWGDERHVPPDDPDSNYGMANQAMLSSVPIRRENVFRIHGEEKEASQAARAYEQTLADFFSLRSGEFPRFDLVLLGMGPDGHTASLFPDSAALEEKTKLVVANWVAKFNTHRITLTFPVLNSAACVLFLVAGADKAPALRGVFEDPGSGLPAQRIQPDNGRCRWLVDRLAAGQLHSRAG